MEELLVSSRLMSLRNVDGLRLTQSKHASRWNARLLNNHLVRWAMSLRLMEASARTLRGTSGRGIGTERPLPRKRKRRSRSKGTRRSRLASGTRLITLRPGPRHRRPPPRGGLLRGELRFVAEAGSYFDRGSGTDRGFANPGSLLVCARRRHMKRLAAFYARYLTSRPPRFGPVPSGRRHQVWRRILSFSWSGSPPDEFRAKNGTCKSCGKPRFDAGFHKPIWRGACFIGVVFPGKRGVGRRPR